MRTMPRPVLIGVAAMCVASTNTLASGCTRNSALREMEASGTSSTGSVSVAVVATPTPEPLPQWADRFLKAASLVGKDKKDVVAKFGPPDNVEGIFGSLRYEYHTPEGDLIFHFNEVKVHISLSGPAPSPEKRTVIGVEALVPKEQRVTVTTACRLLGVGTPDKMFYPGDRLRAYWESPHVFNDHVSKTAGFPVLFQGSLSSKEAIVMEGRSEKAPLNPGERTFDVQKDSYVDGMPVDNPRFRWEEGVIHRLQIGTIVRKGWTLFDFNTEIPLQ